jgi:hypothetical protein
MPDQNENQKDVFAHFGRAAYHAQSFELSLKTIFMLLLRANNHSLTAEALDQCEITLDKQTLGTLIRDIRKVVSFDDASKALTDTALANRNRLMHGFYERHVTDLLSRSGREVVIRELEGYIDSFDIADAVASTVTKAIGKSLGITDSIIDTEVERMGTAASQQDSENA